MSCIEKMMIQGVRSFGPDERDRQVIEFFAPLTLILGPNGTGKTTIIECLKYMTSGVMPPGGNKNAAFIHDPKIANETEVKAQVRLLFRDVRGTRCNVTRSMVATQKAKKIEMKTLDSTISRRNAAGTTTSLSKKCAELDREIISLLGVSKPVLENVIFCHQEDANWPLSEGKALKMKFDDIFASSRYVKALDSIIKFRKEQSAEIKVYQIEIKHLRTYKEKADELKGDLNEIEAKYVASKQVRDDIVVKMNPINEKLEQLRSRYSEIQDIKTQIEKLKAEYHQLEASQKELRKNIKKEFQGSTEDLKQELDDFEIKVQEQQRTLKQKEAIIDKLVEKLNDISEEKSALLVEQGVLQQEKLRQEENIRSRDSFIEKLAQRYDVSGYQAPLTERQVGAFLKVLENRQQDMEEDMRANRSLQEEEESVIQTKIDELRNTKTKLETELGIKLDTLDKNRKEIRDIKQQLNRVEASADKLKDVQRDVKSVDHELSEAEKSVDLDSLKAEITVLADDKVQADAKLKTLDSELNRISLESTARTQLDLFRKEKTSKTDNIRKLKSKIEDSMTQLLGHMPAENLRRALDGCASKLNQNITSTRNQLQNLRSEKTQKETQCKMQREQLNSKENELRGYQLKLDGVSGSQSFDEGLEKLQADLKKAQDEKGHLNGISYLYKKYQTNLKAKDPPCPLCHRPFDSPTEVEELTTELQQKLNLVPAKLETVEVKIDRNKSKVEEMIQLRPMRSAIVDLETTDIPHLRKKIKVLNEQITKLQDDIEKKEDEVDVLSVDESTANSIQTDVTLIDRMQNELKELDRKIAQQSSKLTGGDSDRSMQEVQREREEIQDELETINRGLDRKRQKLSEHSERLQRLRTSLNDLKSQKLQIESDLQQRTRLEDTKIELESSNATLEREVKDCKEEMRPLQDRIIDQERQKMNISRQKEKDYDAGMNKVAVVKEHMKKIETQHQDIENYAKKGNDRALDEHEEMMKTIEAKATKLSCKRDEINEEIVSTKDDLATQQVRERELKDCLLIGEKEVKLTELRKGLETHEKQLGGLDVKNLNQQIREFEADREQLEGQRQQALRKQIGFETQITDKKKQLKDDMYRDADVKYREQMIALRTTELANQDLEKYYKALERTIMAYHTQKMSEINKIIRELWRNTYKGNDIETIEIRSDEEEGSGASKSRRTFNYRVVMIKGDHAIDMRHRCSAGQKVLASLIIRLALAETFCLNCGILALDEPTTNLDRENIESLAYALAEIIKSRSQQKNFQLVIITHDEDFVELLGRSDYVEEFFKVRKNEFGCSQLVRAKVQDLETR